MTFHAIRSLDDGRIVGVIDGDAASVEAQVASLEFAHEKRLPLRKRWGTSRGTTLRFALESYEFCSVRSNAEGRTCVIVTLKLSICEEPKDADKKETKPGAIPQIEVLRHHPAEDLSSLVASIFSDPNNNLLRIFNSVRTSFTQLWGRVELRPSGKLWLYGALAGQREFVMGALDELQFNKLLPAFTRIVRAEEPSDTGLHVRFLRGEVRMNESAHQPGVVEAVVNIQLEPVGDTDRGDTRDSDATGIGPGERPSKDPQSGTNESNNQPESRDAPRPAEGVTSTEAASPARPPVDIERPMEGEWPIKRNPVLSLSRYGLEPQLLRNGKPVEPGDPEWQTVADRARKHDQSDSSEIQQAAEDAPSWETLQEVAYRQEKAIFEAASSARKSKRESSGSKIAAHESSVQIHFEDLSNGEVVNETSIVAVLTRGDNDEDGCRSWSIIGDLEGEPEWVSKVQAKLKRLDDMKTHVLVNVRPRHGESYTIRAQLYGTNIGPAIPSQYDLGVLARVKANVYMTIIELKVPPVEPSPPESGGLDGVESDRDMAPVTPREQRDPDDLARINAQPKNLRTLVEDAHELLSRYEPANLAMLPEYWATTKRPHLDPLLHRIQLLGTAWESATANQTRKKSFYAPIALEHERREVPELLFRGKPITPTDPEWADLVATVRVMEAQAFPLVQVTVKGPKDEIGTNEMGALAAAMEQIERNPVKLECKVTVDGETLANLQHRDASARMRPEDEEAQAALNNVEALLRGTDVLNKEPESLAKSADLQPGESVRVTATEDAFCGMAGKFEAIEDDGRYRVRFVNHGGISIAFARSEIERAHNPETQSLGVATSLQPDPNANPPITEAEANMARKLDEGHRRDMPTIFGLEHVRESSDPIKREPPTVVFHDPKTPLSMIVDREKLAARARELTYTPGEPGTARRAALADMAAKDPQIAEDVAMVAALIDEPIDVFVGPLPGDRGPLFVEHTEDNAQPKAK